MAEKMAIELLSIGEEAITSLQNYHFPNNVRELESTLEVAIPLSDNNTITTQDLHLNPVKNNKQQHPKQSLPSQ